MWFWSWFLRKLSLLLRYLLIQYKGFRFDYDAKTAIAKKTNRKTLFNILKRHRNTKFLQDQLKKAQIESIDSIETFKKLFPNYTSYTDYESYVEQIRHNGIDGDVMSVGFPFALTHTTGTTGAPKNYPVYMLDIDEAYYICYMLTKSIPTNLFTGCKSIPLNSLHCKTYVTPDKLRSYKLSAISTIAASEKQNIETILQFDQTIVPAVISQQVEDLIDLLVFILLWSLQSKEVEVITATFIMTFVNIFTVLEQKFEYLCQHIEEGKIPSDDTLTSPLPLDIRLALESPEYRLKPNPARAQELRNIVKEHGFQHISSRIWPKLKCGICIISHTIKQFESKFLCTYWDPSVPIYPYVYGMSEHHRIAVPLTANGYQVIPLPRSVYYEFIEVENDDESKDDDGDDDDDQSPPALELHQLEEGKCYEVVLTTYNGLYRYRTEDIVKVTGHYYSLPMWELFGRRGQYLSVANEHVTEIELREILDSISNEYKEEFSASAPQFSVFVEKKSYTVAMELDPEKGHDKKRLEQVTNEFCSKFDAELQRSNDAYREGREKRKISPPKLLWVKCNTLTTGTREFRAKKSKGSGANQLKSQLIISGKNKDVIQFIKENGI